MSRTDAHTPYRVRVARREGAVRPVEHAASTGWTPPWLSFGNPNGCTVWVPARGAHIAVMI